ncbi:hypothetical protein [Sedimentitalea todarodis]|uniref:DoxX family protein n=1 Tax=Sedimentitalea todarodis TaxID=1631240 RepID=A0ABU3VA34_9RHOB|nr:hypothetical protein [Sedimentitalea todarodis]MDU9002890.1 hypothetical protein [Sedimentitalea todarodis]
MGPLRRAVIVLLATATPALAEVCDKERPGWTPADGPATGLDEVVFHATSLPGLGILGALTLALLVGGRLYWTLSALFSGVIALALWTTHSAPDDITLAAIAEGCVGPKSLSIGFLAAIFVVALLGLTRNSSRRTD